MERTTVYLPATLKTALERAARDRGRSEAELIREGIRRVVESDAVPPPRLPLFASGHPTLADDVDAALGGFGER